MLSKKFWIPIYVSVFVIVLGGALFYGHKVTNQEPVTTITPASVEQPTTPKPPPPGETYETGHWHGDEWHSEPHEAHTPAEVVSESPSAVPAPQQVSPPPAPDFSDAYQALREKYPEQTQNPPAFENLPVDLWDFEATKKAFTDHFNFYVEHYDPKEGWSHTRELRIAAAVMAGINNAADPWVGLFTPEQRKEIKAMHKRFREFKGVKVNHDRVWELVHDEGYSVLEALRISREEGSDQ